MESLLVCFDGLSIDLRKGVYRFEKRCRLRGDQGKGMLEIVRVDFTCDSL